MNAVKMEEIVQVIPLEHPLSTAVVDNRENTEDCSLFIAKELEKMVLPMMNKKAPGPDCIPCEVL